MIILYMIHFNEIQMKNSFYSPEATVLKYIQFSVFFKSKFLQHMQEDLFLDLYIFITLVTEFQCCKDWSWIISNNINFDFIVFHKK